MVHKEIKMYVDDMMVKFSTGEGHFVSLEKFLERSKKYNLRLNLKKCIFGITSRNLLGHIVSQKGIEVDLDKVKAIRGMPPLKNKKEIRGFIRRL